MSTDDFACLNKLVLLIFSIDSIAFASGRLDRCETELFLAGVQNLVLVTHELRCLLVLVLLDGFCERGVQDLAAVTGSRSGIERVHDPGIRGSGFRLGVRLGRGVAVFRVGGEVVLCGEDVLLAG